MSNLGSAGLILGSMLVLIALRVPIGAAMFVTGAAGYWAVVGENALLSYLKGLLWARFSVYDLSVIPLFLLGTVRLGRRILAHSFPGSEQAHGPRNGGVAMATIIACAAFGASADPRWRPRPCRRSRYQDEADCLSDRLATERSPSAERSIMIPPSVILII
jgi:TRAP-type mannitol/chloroaromatic compound transport system permease large subunit